MLPQGGSGISPEDESQTNQSPTTASVEPEKDQALELLIRKYSSDASLGTAGRIQFIWLNPELIDALLNKYCGEHNTTAAERRKLKTRLNLKLHSADSLAFLAIFRPAKDGFISNPLWIVPQDIGYPDVYLRGSGGQKELPYKWGQIVGDEKFHWYSQPTWGYLIFKARNASGLPLIAHDDFSFSVELTNAAQTTDRALYDTTTDFNYDLMPIQLQSLVDSSIPSWNISLVQMREQRNNYVNYADNGTPSNSYDSGGSLVTTEADATKLSLSDILQIAGLAVQFVEFFLK